MSYKRENFNLLEAVDMMMGKFGFEIRKQINKQFSWQKTLLLVFATFDLCQAMLSFVPLENNERLLDILGDAGVAGFGFQYRYVMNMFYGIYRANLFLMQLNFWFDNHQWLVKANGEFLKIKSLSISNKMRNQVNRARIFVILVAIGMVTATEVQVFITDYTLIQNGIRKLEIFSLNKYFYFLVSQSLQTFHSGAYFVQYYLLTGLCIQFVEQYNQHLKKKIKQKHFISSEQMLQELQQFSNLYVLIHYLKQNLKRAYLIFILCMFCVCTQGYYTLLYTEINIFGKAACGSIFASLIIIIVQFSLSTDKINTKCREMSALIYGSFIESLEKKFSEKLQLEVGCLCISLR